MSVDHALLTRLVQENPFQPATGLWRAMELAEVARHGLPDGRGLDLGCGDGRLMHILLASVARRPELVGIDIDPAEVAQASQLGVYRRVNLASADAVPEPDSSFDWVFSNSTLEHIAPIEGTLAEVARLLRADGLFIFTVPSAEFHGCLRGPVFGSRQKYLASLDRRCAHLRYWDVDQWRVALARHGLELVVADSYLHSSAVRRWELISGLTAGVLHRLTGDHPRRIQRRLGMRRGQRLPRRWADLLAKLIVLGMASDDGGPAGARYIVARRSAT